MDRTIGKYRSELGLPDSTNPQFRTMEFWRSEIEELKRSITNLEARLKHLAGEDILSLGMRDLKQLERQLKIGVERVRSRKRRIISDHATLLKRRHKELQEDNARLQKRVKLNELHHGNISSTIMGENACNMIQQSHKIVDSSTFSFTCALITKLSAKLGVTDQYYFPNATADCHVKRLWNIAGFFKIKVSLKKKKGSHTINYQDLLHQLLIYNSASGSTTA
ncbi:Transcription factor, K-box [Corchorus olitorius]|uniref:Transcription factor, K-box n=1 Tax=Corchorus olitorius TaxID=93759 RepID=A0A1R3KKX0_9ROSI|nr:Transcription factor, K-box [Corchorus olitorius]